jgi:hypothetical protein
MKTNKLVLMEGREILKRDRSAECEELLLLKEESDKRVRFLQYINTGLLTLILGIATMISAQFGSINKAQTFQQSELLRLKTVQDINTNNITILDSRVKILELSWTTELKEWVEQNYVRKAQR